ncbi:hypothetical protein SAMN05444841_105100 [Enterobacter kobei]|nr:hypothetical protein SAMN05444841_105100 [Enterobacter kobei]
MKLFLTPADMRIKKVAGIVHGQLPLPFAQAA